MRFLRNLIAAILGTIIGIFLLFFLFVGIAALMGDTDKIEVKPQSVLVLDLQGMVKDYVPKSDDPLEEVLGVNDENYELAQVLNAINNAKTDPNIKGISIELLNTDLGISQMQAIRKQLVDFKGSGKFLLAYSDYMTQRNYYLSSVADSVFVNPGGVVEFKGLTSEKLYFKDFQEKSGVKLEVIRHGKYKSAMEGFLDNKMSDANREQTLSLLNSIWGELLEDIGTSRKLSIDELNRIADQSGSANLALSVQNRLIDKISYLDEYSDLLKSKTGIEQDKDLEKVTLRDYIKSGKGQVISTAKDKIGILYAQGEIIYGKGTEEYVGQESVLEALKKLREDKSVKAIVLRINSPGGSALASDMIWREIELTKKIKPVVVSMGDLAASGGYYIACNANKIFAEPTTITGSIGVFGAIPNFTGLADKVGINAEQVSTNKGPNYSVFEPMTNEFHDYLKGSVDEIYQTFVAHVSQGRNLTPEQVDSIGQGRVWTGKQAKEIGLVDELGSLEDAINYTASLVKLDKYRLTYYPRYKKEFKDMLSEVNPLMQSKEELISKEIGEENYRLYKTILNYQKMEGIQARLPYEIKIK